MGHKIDNNCLHTCGDKVEAINKVQEPENVLQLKSILGMITYYEKFILNMATILKPLYNLLQKNTTCIWPDDCKNAFIKIKKELTSNKVLVHFNPEVSLKLTVDASPYGLGAVLSHVFN